MNYPAADTDSVEATTKVLEQKLKLNEGGKVFPVGGNVARKVHRNDNPHLDRLHPPQMEELVAQKQVCFLLMIPLYKLIHILYNSTKIKVPIFISLRLASEFRN